MSGFVIPVIPRQNAVAATAPTTSALALGEIALNVRDGILYTNYTPDGTTQTILALCGVGIGAAPGSASPLMNGSVAVGTSLLYSRQDHVHPSDTSRAPLASPTFTGTVVIPIGTISGGTINGAAIGGTTAAAGAFTTLAASSTVTFSGLTASTILGLNGSKVVVSVTLSGGLTAGAGTLGITPSGIIATPPAAKTAAYTAVQGDNNSTIPVNSGSSLAMTLPSLTAGTTITFAQRGAGKVTWTASGTTVTVYPSGSTGSAGQGAQWTAFWDTSTTILISGAVS